MAGRLAVDFGTSNTVIALWDASSSQGIPLHLPGIARIEHQAAEQIAVIPSVIHYGDNGDHKIANEVLAANLYDSERTFRWMKRYVMRRSPVRQRINGREYSHEDAGKEFLCRVLKLAQAHLRLNDEEIAVTIPVESFEHYQNWMAGVLETASLPRFRVIDEPSAAAMGYGQAVTDGDVYLVFDFGGGTLDVAIVRIESNTTPHRASQCRILGKAGAEIGGASLDQLLYQFVLRANDCDPSDDGVRRVSRALLVECERAKERLSFDQQASISVMNPYTGSVYDADISRSAFEDLLDKEHVFDMIGTTVRRALAAARDYGYLEDHIKSVLMVGGSSLIPSVQRLLRQMFGAQRVMLNRPLDAVARGAAAFVAGTQFVDHIQHDYAIRHIDAATNTPHYRTCIRAGTVYPTTQPVDTFFIRAVSDGQREFGLSIYEISHRHAEDPADLLELVFDENGNVRLSSRPSSTHDGRHMFWMNERHPTFLELDRAARKGEAVFNVAFSVDQNKRLLVTVRDLRSGKLVHDNLPVIKLS